MARILTPRFVPAALSDRERAVAERFAAGLTYRQIGEALCIAPSTVRSHLATIYGKAWPYGHLARLLRGTEDDPARHHAAIAWSLLAHGRKREAQSVLDAVTQRDYPVIQGVILLSSFAYVAVNLMIDLSYGLFDPRIRTTA